MNETTVVQAKPAAESHYFTPEHDILMFNEHAYIKRMTACGFDAQQAESLAAEQGDLLNNLATRVDVDNINVSFDKVYMRFQDVDQRFVEIDLRFDQIDQRFVEIDLRFDQIDQRFVEIDQRFVEIDQRFVEIDLRFDQIDQRFVEIDQRFDQIDQRFVEIGQRFEKVEQSIEELRQEMKQEFTDIRQNMATKEELEEMRQNMVTKKDLDVAISNAKEDMAKWMVGQLILIVGFIFTLNKFTL